MADAMAVVLPQFLLLANRLKNIGEDLKFFKLIF